MKETGTFLILVVALLAFEIFNFSVTQYALLDLIGAFAFAGFRLASILATAFCLIDFGGIARIFTPETGRDEPGFVWYLFVMWLLAAGINATLIWWGIKVAMIIAGTYISLIPVLIAVVVFVVRILLISSLVHGEWVFSKDPSKKD